MTDQACRLNTAGVSVHEKTNSASLGSIQSNYKLSLKAIYPYKSSTTYNQLAIYRALLMHESGMNFFDRLTCGFQSTSLIQSTHNNTPGRPVHTNTSSASLGSIQPCSNFYAINDSFT